jgi:hypothetical protein
LVARASNAFSMESSRLSNSRLPSTSLLTSSRRATVGSGTIQNVLVGARLTNVSVRVIVATVAVLTPSVKVIVVLVSLFDC